MKIQDLIARMDGINLFGPVSPPKSTPAAANTAATATAPASSTLLTSPPSNREISKINSSQQQNQQQNNVPEANELMRVERRVAQRSVLKERPSTSPQSTSSRPPMHVSARKRV